MVLSPRSSADRGLLGLPRPVWLLGWVSLATDAATEAIYPLLPFFLTQVLGAGPASLGLIEGMDREIAKPREVLQENRQAGLPVFLALLPDHENQIRSAAVKRFLANETVSARPPPTAKPPLPPFPL